MGILRAFCAAFLTFSAIPMPKINYKDEDMKYMFIFFPLIGVIIGGLSFIWSLASTVLLIGGIVHALLLLAIPIIVTGGIHIDGFIDTMDAVSSYKTREQRLAIMKDPHIGGFVVIRFTLYLLLFLSAVMCLYGDGLKIYYSTFILSRAGSALSVCLFPAAKSEGMLASEKKEGANKVVLAFTFAWILATVAFIVLNGEIYGIVTAVLFALSLILYYLRSKKDYGGITGDLAGAYILMSQLLMTGGLALLGILENGGLL